MPRQFDSGFRINPQNSCCGGCVVFCSREDLSKSKLLWAAEGGIAIVCVTDPLSPAPPCCFAIHSPVLSLSAVTQLARFYLLWQRKQGLGEGGWPLDPTFSLFCCFDTHIIPKPSLNDMNKREGARRQLCFLRRWLLTMDNISTQWLGSQVFCFNIQSLTRLWLIIPVRQRATASKP